MRKEIGTRTENQNLPFPLRRDEVVHAQLPVNLFQAKMDCIIIQMSLGDTISRNCCGQARYFRLSISPPATTFARGIWVRWRIYARSEVSIWSGSVKTMTSCIAKLARLVVSRTICGGGRLILGCSTVEYLRVAELDAGESSRLWRELSRSLGGARGYADGEGWASCGGAASSTGAGPNLRRLPRGAANPVSCAKRYLEVRDLLSLVPVTSRVAGLHIFTGGWIFGY